MAIVLLSTDSDVEVGELPREVWFKMAVSKDREEIEAPHGMIAADGYRIHVDNLADECDCGDTDTHKKIERVVDISRKEARFAFAVSKEFLLEAIAGIDDDILLFFCGKSNEPVIVQERENGRAAIIMPVDVIKPVPTPHLPYSIGVDTEQAPTPDSADGMF
jgi:hypothetical protein